MPRGSRRREQDSRGPRLAGGGRKAWWRREHRETCSPRLSALAEIRLAEMVGESKKDLPMWLTETAESRGEKKEEKKERGKKRKNKKRLKRRRKKDKIE